MNDYAASETGPVLDRGQLKRHAILYTVLALPLLAGVVIGALNLYIPLLVICIIFGAAAAFLAWHHIRDLGAQPVVTEGEITKKWTKGNILFFFMHGYYIAVQGNIYSIRHAEYVSLLERDLVRVHHFPYSLTVGYLERYDEVEKAYVPADDYGLGRV